MRARQKPAIVDTRRVQDRPSDGARRWELGIEEQADPQKILQECFSRGIRLKSFELADPSLHEVFVELVGADAKEAAYR